MRTIRTVILFLLCHVALCDTDFLEEKARLAEEGDVDAQVYMAELSLKGDKLPKNEIAAVYWAEKAAEQNYANAQKNLGVIYVNGWGVEKNIVQSVYWFEKAARLGNVEAQKALGDIHYDNSSFMKDHVKAHIWYSVAKLNKFEFSMENLRDLNRLKKSLTREQLEAAEKKINEICQKLKISFN